MQRQAGQGVREQFGFLLETNDNGSDQCGLLSKSDRTLMARIVPPVN